MKLFSFLKPSTDDKNIEGSNFDPDNRYFTWTSGASNSFSDPAVWNTQYGFDGYSSFSNRTHDNDDSATVESEAPGNQNVDNHQMTSRDGVVTTQPSGDQEDDNYVPLDDRDELFLDKDGNPIQRGLPVHIKIIVITAMIICRPYGEKALNHTVLTTNIQFKDRTTYQWYKKPLLTTNVDVVSDNNIYQMLIYRRRGQHEEAKRHLSLAKKFTTFSYISCLIYLTLTALFIYITIKF